MIGAASDLCATALYTPELCRAGLMYFESCGQDKGDILALEPVEPDLECLKTMTEAELEMKTVMLLELHRRCGHPGRQAFLKTLRARGSDAKTLAVASQLKCPECIEGQMKKPSPVVSLEAEETLWRTLQMDSFFFKHGKMTHHCLLFLDEASSFAVVAEMNVHPAEESENIDAPGMLTALEEHWIQYFGFPSRIKCDLEGCFRGRLFENYCAGRGIELITVPAEHHQATGAVERTTGELRHRIEKFLRLEEGPPKRAAFHMVAAHNHVARVGGYSPSQWVFGRSAPAWNLSRAPLCKQSLGTKCTSLWN